MTLFFDENISYRIVKKIQNDFPGCLHVTDVSPSVKGDMQIFQFAKQNSNSSTQRMLRKLLDRKHEIVSFFESDELGLLEIY